MDPPNHLLRFSTQTELKHKPVQTSTTSTFSISQKIPTMSGNASTRFTRSSLQTTGKRSAPPANDKGDNKKKPKSAEGGRKTHVVCDTCSFSAFLISILPFTLRTT